MRFCPRCLSVYAADMSRCALDGTALERPSSDPLVGNIIAGREVRERIGLGSTGAVYLVEKTGEAPLAMKLLYGELAANERVVKRFLDGADLASKIDHQSVVAPVTHGRTPDGLCFLLMPYVAGRTLSSVLASSEPLSPPRAANIVKQIASGLAAAHAKGCIHRDIKTSNIMLTREDRSERARIVDFGLVALLSELPHRDTLVGTPRYLAPEVARDPSAASPASDLYALGVILYEMLTGSPPFDGASVVDVIMKHTLDLPPPIGDALGLEVIATWLLEKTPENRPQTGTMVAQEVDGLEIAPYLIPDDQQDDPTLDPRPAVVTAAFTDEEVVTEDLLPEAEEIIPIVQPILSGADAILGYEFLRGRFDLTAETIVACGLLHEHQRSMFMGHLEDLRSGLEPGRPAADYMNIAGELARLNVQIEEASEITES